MGLGKQMITIWLTLGLEIMGFHIMETEALFRNLSVGSLYKYTLMNISFFMASKMCIIGPSVRKGVNVGGVNVGRQGCPQLYCSLRQCVIIRRQYIITY